MANGNGNGKPAVSYAPYMHPGVPDLSLQYVWKPSSPTNPATRVSPEFGFRDKHLIGESRKNMAGRPPKAIYKQAEALRSTTYQAMSIARGLKAVPPDDYKVGGKGLPMAQRLRGQASTAEPSIPGAAVGKILPVGERQISTLSKRARRFFGVRPGIVGGAA